MLFVNSYRHVHAEVAVEIAVGLVGIVVVEELVGIVVVVGVLVDIAVVAVAAVAEAGIVVEEVAGKYVD